MQYILIVFYLNEKIVLRRINMKLKFIRSVIAFCLSMTLAFNSVILAFAAPEDFYDLPLETQKQQQERLLKLLPDLYKSLQLCAYNSSLAKELNHINLANEILELKGIQEKQKAFLSEAQNSQQIINDGLQQLEEQLKDQQGEQLQKLQKEQKEKQKKLKELQEEAENRQNLLEPLQKLQKTLEKTLYSQVLQELPNLIKLSYEINDNYDNIDFTRRKENFLNKLQDVTQELYRQKIERLQYQCYKQKEKINNYELLLSAQNSLLSAELSALQ